MKKISFVLLFASLFAGVKAQHFVPEYACFGGTITIDSANIPVIHHVRSNVFRIVRLVREFKGSSADWAELQSKIITEANKQLAEKGYHSTISHTRVISYFETKEKTQEALDIWNKREPADVILEIKPDSPDSDNYSSGKAK